MNKSTYIIKIIHRGSKSAYFAGFVFDYAECVLMTMNRDRAKNFSDEEDVMIVKLFLEEKGWAAEGLAL